MKKTTAKVISVSDIIQWNRKEEIELSPKYQRNSVWNENAKSYLIDTLVRGLPIPPVFIRQKVDILTKSTFREVIDGQQRIRTIIEFIVNESFCIKKSHNSELGGCYYRDLTEEQQESLLEYEILAEVVSERDDSIIYDMFARLNSNNIVLNKQELRNAMYWGEFKVLVYRLSSQVRDFFLLNGIMNDKECSRMKDAEFISSLLILLTEGIVSETPKYVDGIYRKYDDCFDDAELVGRRFIDVFSILQGVYEYYPGSMGPFYNKNYFYTLFGVIYNQMFGIIGSEFRRSPLFGMETINNNIYSLYSAVSDFLARFKNQISEDVNDEGFSVFIQAHKSRTTNKPERIRRLQFLNDSLVGNL